MGKSNYVPRQAACANRPKAFWTEPLQSSNSNAAPPGAAFELDPFRATIVNAIRKSTENIVPRFDLVKTVKNKNESENTCPLFRCCYLFAPNYCCS